MHSAIAESIGPHSEFAESPCIAHRESVRAVAADAPSSSSNRPTRSATTASARSSSAR